MSEITISYGIENDQTQSHLFTSEMTINCNFWNDATQLWLLHALGDGKQAADSLQCVWDDDKLPTLSWRNATVSLMCKTRIHYQLLAIRCNTSASTLHLWWHYTIFRRYPASKIAIKDYRKKSIGIKKSDCVHSSRHSRKGYISFHLDFGFELWLTFWLNG